MDITKQQRLRKIHQAVIQGYYVYSDHADEEMLVRNITRREIEAVLLHGEMIEHYAHRPEGEACLVMGQTATGRVLHVACGLSDPVVIITAYEPDPAEWESDWRTRRTR